MFPLLIGKYIANRGSLKGPLITVHKHEVFHIVESKSRTLIQVTAAQARNHEMTKEIFPRRRCNIEAFVFSSISSCQLYVVPMPHQRIMRREIKLLHPTAEETCHTETGSARRHQKDDLEIESVPLGDKSQRTEEFQCAISSYDPVIYFRWAIWTKCGLRQ